MKSGVVGAKQEPGDPAPPRPPERPRRRVLIALGVVLVAAGWLRFADLGRLSFWADEFPHAIAARSLIHDRKPVLPSGRQYRRALAQTVAVAASMRAFGENETAARVPSAIVGVLSVAGVWLVTRRRFGDAAALAAAAVITVMPQHVAHSRSARFYAAFALAYGAAATLGTGALETRSRKTIVGALAAFAIALHLQVEAVTLLLPLILYAVYLRSRSPEHKRSLGRAAAALAAAGVIAAIVIVAVPPLRHGASWLIEHLPGVELKPGLHLDTLGKLFGVVSWWAWILLAPAALAGLWRAGRSGVALALHLLAPAVLIAVLFAPTSARGIGSRYLFYLLPFLAVLAGVAAAEIARAASRLLRRAKEPGPATAIAAALIGALVVAGGPTVLRLPSESHPGRIIPRPNWNLATSIIRAEQRDGDALLSTSPLAPAWALGRCADWVRIQQIAETFLEDGRDIYCASELISGLDDLRAYLDVHPHGWVIADPAQWRSIVDPAVRATIERTATPVDRGDPTILIWRWGA